MQNIQRRKTDSDTYINARGISHGHYCKAAVAHILYRTTLCNHLRVWARRASTADELTGITYGAALPDDLKANMEAIINAVSAR